MLADFADFEFAQVIHLPAVYEIFDFSNGYDKDRALKSPYGIGRYNERRPGMYNTELFKSEPSAVRDIHIGIDIAAPVGTPVYAFFDGHVFAAGINSAEGDYGGTLITEHQIGHQIIWALHGHLSHASVHKQKVGARFARGEVLAQLGSSSENGNWNPHLHFQLARVKPERCDMPGAVNERDLAKALVEYPDPRLVLGPLYK